MGIANVIQQTIICDNPDCDVTAWELGAPLATKQWMLVDGALDVGFKFVTGSEWGDGRWLCPDCQGENDAKDSD